MIIDKILFLDYIPPMGIYETLYAFFSIFGKYIGEEGTSPWSQGFPRTDQLPSGPKLPDSIEIDEHGRKYPKAWGLPALRESVAYYYNDYGSKITSDNVMVFASGRH